MEEAIVPAVYGLGVGVVAAATVSVLGPFARGEEGTLEALALLATLCALCLAGGALVLDSWTVVGITGAAAALGGAGAWVAGRGGGGVEVEVEVESGLLSTTELRRAKRDNDRWLLVTGAPLAGKSTIVRRLVAAARRNQGVALAANPRASADGDVVELRLRAGGGERRLRLWERGWGEGALREPRPRDLDGVVVVIDPTCVAETATSFPDAVKAAPEAVDVNGQALALDAALAKAGAEASLWYVIAKADLIRFSIAPPLLNLVKAGTAWEQQLRNFNIPERRSLAEALGLDERNGRALTHAQGSPLLAYAGRDERGTGAFGGAELFGVIIDTLLADARSRDEAVISSWERPDA